MLVALLAGLACHPPDPLRDVPTLDARLLAAIERFRQPLPRFTGSAPTVPGFRPRAGEPCPPALASPGLAQLDAAERRPLVHIGREIDRLAAAHGGAPSVLRLQALWTLLTTSTDSGRERMVRQFYAALTQDRRSLRRRNDLAAAQLIRAGSAGSCSGFAAALELLDPHSTAGRPWPAELLVNRAYALHCLTLWDEAQETWKQLPAAGAAPAPDVPSAAGVDTRAGVPTHGIAADPLARRWRGEWLLGEWGEQRLRGNAAAAGNLLREAEAIGAALRTATGDSLLQFAVAAIRQAEATGKRSALMALMQGHAAFHSVRRNAIYSECRPAVLRLAETQLTRGKSPFVRWVRLDQAVCAYFAQDLARSEAILKPLVTRAEDSGELALQGRAEWMLGLLSVVRARFTDADLHYSRAVALFTRLGEQGHVTYLRSLRARNYEYGGAREAASRERMACLRSRAAVTDPTRLFVIFDEAVQALQNQGYRAAALEFLSEQMRAAEAGARQPGKTDLLVFTRLARAGLLAETGDQAGAARDVTGAEEAWARLSTFNESRDRLRVEIDLQRVVLDRLATPAAALAAIDRATAFFAGAASSLGGQLQILKLDQLRAQVDLRRGDVAAARADLLQGAAEIERQRLGLATMEDRAGFLTQTRKLFVDLIRLQLDGFHDPRAALEALERGSNRVLADTARGGSGEAHGILPLRVDRLADLPADMVVVRFGHLPERLLLWSFADGRWDFEQRWLAEADLRDQVKGCTALAARQGAATEREAACQALSRHLLPRRLAELAVRPGTRTVILVPDESLASLPFAVLRVTPRGPYLLERFRLCYAPSLALLLSGGHALDRRRTSPPRSALFVSDPAFSRELYPTLADLPAARHAAAQYSTSYPETRILSGRDATVPAVLAALDRYEILHFDGHSLTNAQYPERGGLLLAPVAAGSDRAPQLLTADSLQPQALRRLRLVVLGACSTGLTAYRDTAETAGLAAAFLARGVPEVVAAAWQVPDDQTAELLSLFHRALASGRPAVEALQSAQITLLHARPDDFAAWGAFKLFVG